MEGLRKTVLRDGNIAIFGPATGITVGKRLRADLASEFLCIPLELRRQESPRLVTVDCFDHPITAERQDHRKDRRDHSCRVGACPVLPGAKECTLHLQ